MTRTDELLNAWGALCTRTGLKGLDYVGQDLVNRYAEAHRVYHSVDHLWHVTRLLVELGGNDNLLLAAWFHDAIYDPARHDNEAQSAALARSALQTGGYSETGTAFVCDAIMSTAGHATTGASFDTLLDADLAILGAPEAAYASYRTGVRREYQAVPDEAFRAGRGAFIGSMLRRPSIYRTPEGWRRFEAQARINLQAELASLQHP